MHKGWYVCNAFLNTEKFNELREMMIASAARLNIDLQVKTNAELLCVVNTGSVALLDGAVPPGFVLFSDKDLRLAKSLESMGLRLFNTAAAIEVCDDKSLTQRVLCAHGIPMPKTICCPMTYEGVGYSDMRFVARVVDELGLPLVVKECYGSFGQQVHLADTPGDVHAIVRQIGYRPLLFQEFIATSRGHDLRVNVVGERCVAAMYRYSESDFRANITAGARMQPYEPTEEQAALAVACCRYLGLDFAGVDILFGEHETPLVCEVNSNAQVRNIFDCTGINIADAIFDYILRTLARERSSA